MFEIGKILKRSFQILWNYKVLWVFAFLIAVTGGGGGSGGSSGGGGSNFSTTMNNNMNGTQNFGQLSPMLGEVESWFTANVAPLFATEAKAITTTLIIVGIVAGIALIFGLLFSLVRYPAVTAVLRMVNEHESTGSKVKFKEGWKLGWNRRAFRLWLIDLVIGVPAFGFVLTLLGIGAFILIRNADNLQRLITPGIVILFLLFGLFFIAFALFMVVVGLVRQFIIRSAALDETGVWESFRRGWAMFKANFKNAALMWLVMVGVNIGAGIAMLIAAIILIPAYLILAIPGAIVAAIPGVIGYGIGSLFGVNVVAWIVAGVLGLPFFFLIVFAPVTLISGLYAVYESSVWTLTYRQMKAMAVPPPAFEAAEASKPPVLP
jgi:hypothetical protein